MGEFLIPVILVAGIGLLAGILLSVASVLMAVPKDEKAEAITEMLPGANCGACGFSGCSGYAKALSEGSAKVGKCSPGGAETANKISAFLGGGDAEVEYKEASVMCLGSYDNTTDKMIYSGIKSCSAASLLAGGIASCRFGCLGFGDCAAVCPNNAIEVCNGVAHINSALCSGCGQCAEVCPKKIIGVIPKKPQAVVKCSNCDKGAVSAKNCSIGCIGCGKCMKACEAGAIKVTNFKATVDSAVCTGCGKCAEICPRGCISMLN